MPKAFTFLKSLATIVGGGEHAELERYRLAEKVSAILYPKYKFSEYGRIFLEDRGFLQYYQKFADRANFHSLDRKYLLNELAKHCANLDGDTAECGAYQGASSYLICEQIKDKGKTHHVFDSFEGLSKPLEEDGDYWKKGNLTSSLDIIERNLSDFNFVSYYKGWIPDRFSEVEHLKFSLVHIDVDLYQPTLDSISFFYPRLNPGGMIVCDDYGFLSCPGALKAMDEYFSDKPEVVMSLPTGQGLVIKS